MPPEAGSPRLTRPSDRGPGWALAVAYTVIGLGLCLQPTRFSRTPAYGNLIALLDAEIWGVLYLVVAALFMVFFLAIPHRILGITTHTAAIMLTGLWWTAFVIRYLSDPSTTVVNVVSWGMFLYVIVHSAVLLDVAVDTRRSDV